MNFEERERHFFFHGHVPDNAGHRTAPMSAEEYQEKFGKVQASPKCNKQSGTLMVQIAPQDIRAALDGPNGEEVAYYLSRCTTLARQVAYESYKPRMTLEWGHDNRARLGGIFAGFVEAMKRGICGSRLAETLRAEEVGTVPDQRPPGQFTAVAEPAQQ